MTFQVQITKAAAVQIEAAYLWLKKQNREFADQWFRGLMNALDG